MHVPLVGTLVSDSYSEQRTSHFSFSRKLAFRFFQKLDRWTSEIPVRWIANSVSIKNSNAQVLKIDPMSIEVVYRGRDVHAFMPWQSPTMPPFRFVFVGRLLETKGLRELVESFAQLSAAQESVQLDIYGDGPFRRELELLINNYKITDKVIMHGRVPNAWQQLYACHCFVFPSWYEGFSGALVEAMMTGVPIIASNIPMNLEAIADGKTAHVFQVRDAQDLLQKMQETINNYQAAINMGIQARFVAYERFDQKNISRQYFHILAEVAKKST